MVVSVLGTLGLFLRLCYALKSIISRILIISPHFYKLFFSLYNRKNISITPASLVLVYLLIVVITKVNVFVTFEKSRMKIVEVWHWRYLAGCSFDTLEGKIWVMWKRTVIKCCPFIQLSFFGFLVFWVLLIFLHIFEEVKTFEIFLLWFLGKMSQILCLAYKHQCVSFGEAEVLGEVLLNHYQVLTHKGSGQKQALYMEGRELIVSLIKELLWFQFQ